LRLSFLPVLLAAGKGGVWSTFPISNFYLLVGRWLDDRSQGRAELAGGEGVEGAEAAGEFASGQLAVAEERAEKILGGAGALFRIAIPAAGDEVAVGIVAGPYARDDVIETPRQAGEAAQTIEAAPSLSRMEGFAQGRRA
jgi:hypothetical protein